MTPDQQKTALSISFVSIIINVLLSILKGVLGVVAHSNALISDAVHSLSDVFSTIIVIIGIKAAAQEPDRDHPYGHERFECVAAIILAGILFLAGLGIGSSVMNHLFDEQPVLIPNVIALGTAIFSIAIKEALYWYTHFYAKKLQSDLLMADAWHHRSDALSSIGALIGIGGAMMGYPIMDLLAGLVIVGIIFKTAYTIFKEAIDNMVDHACDEKTEQAIYHFVLQHQDIIGINMLHTRLFAQKIYIDLEIEVDGTLPLQTAHAIAENIHTAVENQFKNVKHIMVSVTPSPLTTF